MPMLADLACAPDIREPIFATYKSKPAASQDVIRPHPLIRLMLTVAGVLPLWLGLSSAGRAVPPEGAPQGVASCASSVCHGATAPLGVHPIRQDEYFIWQRQDAHRQAYRVLLSARGERIGKAMGIDVATAPECLTCHAEQADMAQPGVAVHQADGIGCEACHGRAGGWLAEHTRPGITLEEKVKLGMTPIWQRDTRAALCLGCHQGDTTRRITHEMMAAGHPRLVFELDTFSTLQPLHYDHDADYAERKGAYAPAQDWLAGQLRATENHLQALADGRQLQGWLPDWVAFDCAACHHGMESERWQASRMPGARAGAVPFADTPQQMLMLWLSVVDVREAEAWRVAMRQLIAAQSSGVAAVRAAARMQAQQLQLRLRPLATRPLTAVQLRGLLRALVRDTSHASAPISHEQRAMAFTVFADALRLAGAPPSRSLRLAIDAYYDTVRSVDRFEPEAHQRALAAVARALPD